ncbi:TRAP transporter small permease [Crassaminicella thermophila]|uniref:TRAP transporter small permease n=1 Tax=Crassaminicella thermophila TaxID=2599308 RepID=A0A5C0SBM0_CRATE|nr:TRAP transporter small permease [Crassaminicella thermophila]QEK11490.1 TRAP transporter small permease [Crassaminicella thermophila]
MGKFFEILGKIQEKILMFLTILIPLLVTFQVILRYVLHAPLMGIEELMLFPIIWLYMLGGASASRARNHIECGILTLYIKKEKSMAIFKVVKTAISLMISIWLTYWAYWFFTYSLKMWKVSDLLYIPMFFGESSIFIGLTLMTMYSAIELYDMIKNLLNISKSIKEGGVKC